jgi:hypothetical protein
VVPGSLNFGALAKSLDGWGADFVYERNTVMDLGAIESLAGDRATLLTGVAIGVVVTATMVLLAVLF